MPMCEGKLSNEEWKLSPMHLVVLVEFFDADVEQQQSIIV